MAILNTEPDGIYYGYYIDTLTTGRLVNVSKRPEEINDQVARETARLRRQKQFVQVRTGFVISSTVDGARTECRRNNFVPKRWAQDIATRMRVRAGDMIG